MMHKRTLHSLLIVSFIAVFAASMSFAADEVIVGSQSNLYRCSDNSVAITANLDNDVSAIEVVVEVIGDGCLDLLDINIVWNLDGAVLTDRVIDDTMLPLIRIAAMSTGATAEYLAAGANLPIATIEFTTSDCCEGSVDIAGATWASDPPFGPIQTQIVVADGGALIPITPVTGVIGVTNKLPGIANLIGAPFTVVHGSLFEYTLDASDADLPDCEDLTYEVIGGPEGMEVIDGILTWQTDGADICEFDGDIVVKVTDLCDAEAETEAFQICVSNEAPAFTVFPTENYEIAWGETVATTIVAVDPDGGPFGPFYSIVNWGYSVPAPTIDVNTGDLSFTAGYSSDYSQAFVVEVKVSDGANECETCAPVNFTTDSFIIEVNAFALTISKEEHVFVGQSRVVTISMLDEAFFQPEMGGFDFLIQYDNSAMAFQFAEEGSFLADCEWEYFTYRYGANGNCGAGACPSGIIRIVGMAETTGGNLAHHPICTNTGDASEDLVYLHFLVGTDANLECNFASIRFVWYDCADNGVSSPTGDMLLISSTVWDFAGFVGGESIFDEITGLDQTFPTLTGAPDIADCNQEIDGWKHPWRLVHLFNGGLDIVCADSIDAVGDININNIAYEIADAVMLTNYFINGVSAFGDHVEGSIAASDTNKDGISLSVADLVYLIRVIVGDAVPYAKVEPRESVTQYFKQGNGTLAITGDIGAAHIVLEGDVVPTNLTGNMTMEYKFDGQNTNVVIYSHTNQSFTGNFLQAEGNIVSRDFASNLGQTVVAKLVPTNFEVSQNYPNPFNPTTKFEFTVPNGGDWKLGIYNINGQLVETFSGNSVSGVEIVEWDASTLSSGVYFYNVVAGNNSVTKKAVLLK
jgi:hypothetical protein